MAEPKKLNKGDILFREGDTPEAMYVIKSGKMAIMKTKGSSEIQLAELGPGDMLGEMAFFDNKPRSAGAKALSNTEVIELPFKALNAQFKTFPEWLKAIMRAVNSHLRNANIKIKNFEKSVDDEATFFTPHLVTRLAAILGLVAHKYGEKIAEGTLLPPNRLRNYTIQIFQQPTAKMTRFQELLQGLGHMKIEDLGEGKQRITLFNPDMLMSFADYYNDWIFTSEEKRIAIDEKELRPLRALVHFGRKNAVAANAAANGAVNSVGNSPVKVNLTQMQAESMRDLGYLFTADDVNSLAEKKVTGDKTAGDGGTLYLAFDLIEIESLCQRWEIIHACRKFAPAQ